MIKLIIFDFDGTIVDSRQVYYHAIEKNLSYLGLHKKAADKLIDKGLSISESLKNLGLSWFTRFFMKRRIMKSVLNHAEQIKKCRDVSAIKTIKTRKILVSNSLDEFVMPVLKHLKLEREFSEIYGADNFSNKEKFVKDYLDSNWLKKEEVLYVGDRVADVNLAKKAGCISVIITGKCAWNSIKDIKKAKPDYILKDIKEIKKLVES